MGVLGRASHRAAIGGRELVSGATHRNHDRSTDRRHRSPGARRSRHERRQTPRTSPRPHRSRASRREALLSPTKQVASPSPSLRGQRSEERSCQKDWQWLCTPPGVRPAPTIHAYNTYSNIVTKRAGGVQNNKTNGPAGRETLGRAEAVRSADDPHSWRGVHSFSGAESLGPGHVSRLAAGAHPHPIHRSACPPAFPGRMGCPRWF
eukprot:scaffold34629_cov135-Isochrysis_galbana.AAC.1